MIEISKNYKEYLNTLTKNNLVAIVKDYHELCDIYNFDKGLNIEKKKKQDVLDYIIDNINNYLVFFVKSLDLTDFEILKLIISNPKKVTDEFLVENREFINFLLTKSILFQKENLEIPNDINHILKNILNDKNVSLYVKKCNRVYMISSGLVVAYGVVDKGYFEKRLKDLDENALLKVAYYYKKDYVIEEKRVVSKKLSNKKKINKYLKNQNYKEFTNKELSELGESIYHHEIKSYKKLIKMLKNNYVFKNNDIMYVDKVIIIPYLYNSLNEEEVANKTLEETVIKLFEFKGETLKNKMLENIKKVREDFPLWEYRGKSKNEVK